MFATQFDTVGVDQTHRGAQHRAVLVRLQEVGLIGKPGGVGHVVGIHGRHQIGPGGLRPVVAGAGDTGVGPGDDPQPRIAAGHAPEDRQRSVGRSVIHRDQFEVGQRLAEDTGHGAGQVALAVEHRQDHGDTRRPWPRGGQARRRNDMGISKPHGVQSPRRPRIAAGTGVSRRWRGPIMGRGLQTSPRTSA